MKHILSIVCSIIFVLTTNAQNKTMLVQRINEIKNQNDIYFWDQYTHPDADTAKYNAIKRLLLDVNNKRNENDQLSVEEIMPNISSIPIDRGNLKQFFVYIKKTDAELIKGASTPVIAVAPKPISPKSFVPDAFVQRIMETKSFMNVYKLLQSLQAQGQILQFGKLRDVKDYSSLDLILFDMQSQEIVTMLSPVTASGNRTNVVNGSEDSLDNYPTNMTAVIWYIRNKKK